jgi:molybdate transport system ATP-binding protein
MAARLLARFRRRHAGGPAVEADVELDPDWQVTVVFGPSGAGKTTLLRCLAGLERPQQGLIRFGAETWLDTERGVDVPPQQRRVGFLFQEYALFPHLDVRANVAYGLRGPRPERPPQLESAMRLLDLEALAHRRPRELSGGQRQRVALARALACAPGLLLLDEPLSALDAPAREPLRHELRLLLVRLGLPAVIVTHDHAEALALGDGLVVMVDGRVRQAGPVAEVFTRPADLDVARAVGVENVVPSRVVDRRDGLVTLDANGVRLSGVDPGGPLGVQAYACIQAGDVVLERGEAHGGSSVRNHLAGRVTTLAAEGPVVRVTVDCGFPLRAVITRVGSEELRLRDGEPVTAAVKATAVHVVTRAG